MIFYKEKYIKLGNTILYNHTHIFSMFVNFLAFFLYLPIHYY